MKKNKKEVFIKDPSGWMKATKNCFRNGITVYPFWNGLNWVLHINNNGNITKGEKVLSTKKTLQAENFNMQIKETYIYLNEKLKL